MKYEDIENILKKVQNNPIKTILVLTVLLGMFIGGAYIKAYIETKAKHHAQSPEDNQRKNRQHNSLARETVTQELDILEEIKSNNGNATIIRTNEFPEIQFLVTGDIHDYYPPYEVQILFDYENYAYISDHISEIKYTFAPLITLGEELKTNIIRKDNLGIRIKTNYSSSQNRNKVFSEVASVVYNLYYKVIDLSETKKLVIERYNKSKHLPVPEDLW